MSNLKSVLNKKKILIIDDEEDILNFISYNLENDGCEVATANRGKLGLEKANEVIPDLILLDIMMPDMDGIEVCRVLRSNPAFDSTLIAFLTARGEDYTQIAALDYGGDDFIVKPIRPDVLRSRLNALFRLRHREHGSNVKLEVGNLSLDPVKFEVVLEGEKINFARKEFQILELLMSSPGKVFSRQEIFHKIWNNDVIVGERTIDVHIRRIREKIGDQFVKTLKGVGYKIEDNV